MSFIAEVAYSSISTEPLRAFEVLLSNLSSKESNNDSAYAGFFSVHEVPPPRDTAPYGESPFYLCRSDFQATTLTLVPFSPSTFLDPSDSSDAADKDAELLSSGRSGTCKT